MTELASTPPKHELWNYSPSLVNELARNLSPTERLELARLLEAEVNREAWERMGKQAASLDAGPLLWATKYTKTEDTHWLNKGTEFKCSFPSKSYLVAMMQLFFDHPTLFVWKSREMMTSWLVSLYITWMCQWYPVFWLAQTQKETKVMELIQYARILYRNQPEWMKARNPLIVDNDTELEWKQGGRYLGIPRGANQSRIHHPHGYFQDESAFLDEAEASYNAVRPVVKQVICVSTDDIGWYHNECKLEQ